MKAKVYSGAEPWHGKRGGYTNKGCRCEQCRAAARGYQQRYRRHYAGQAARERLERALTEDRLAEPFSEEMVAGVVMLYAMEADLVGDAQELAWRLGYDEDLVREIAANLEANGVWKDGATHCDWFEDDAGAVAFACDVLVGAGKVVREPAAGTS